MRTWFRNLSIRKKILMVFLLLIIFSLFTLAYVTNAISTSEIIKKTNKSVSDNSNLIMTRIDSVLSNAESCANILLININRVVAQRSIPGKSIITDLKMTSLLNNELTFGMLIFPEVESAIFVNMEKRIYRRIFNKNPDDERDEVLKAGFFKQIDASDRKDVWLPMQKRDYLSTNGSTPILTLVKKTNNIDTGEQMGYVIVNIEENTFASIYKNIGVPGSGTYLITDKDGRIISSPNKEDLFKPIGNTGLIKEIQSNNNVSEIRKIDGRDTLVIINSFTRLDWKLVSQIPLKELTAENRKITLLIFLIGLVCLIFAIFGSMILSNIISKPIIRLTKHMLKSRDGNSDLYSAPGTTDEIGLLASAFNTMIARNKELLGRIDYEQKKKREYELALMQSQIKPHFLYNTLDVVCRLADMNRNSEVRKAAKALADFYRVALSKGREYIRLSEEISNVENYLSIQKIRYANVFDFEISIAPDILDCSIPKLTLQPLVENSIYHGLKTSGKRGRITIEGHREDDAVVLCVLDDGIGMSAERLKGILAEDGKHVTNQSFGLKNLNERIRIFYGSGFGITIYSEELKGTKIIIRIPARQGGEQDYDKADAGGR